MKIVRSALRAVLAGLTLGIFFTAANAQNVLTGAADYWPFKEGNTWTLLTKVRDQQVDQVVTVVNIAKKDGKTEARLEYKFRQNGQTIQTEIYQSDSKSLSRIASGPNASGKISPPFPVVLYPLTDGKKWDWKGMITINGQEFKGVSKQTASGPENITSSAGTFKAMRVHVDLTVSSQGKDQKLINDYWFAPNVGLIKQKATLGGVEFDCALSSFKLK